MTRGINDEDRARTGAKPSFKLTKGGYIIRETEDAVFVDVGVTEIAALEGKTKVWIPRSQIHEESTVKTHADKRGEFLITEWFAKEKGWTEDTATQQTSASGRMVPPGHKLWFGVAVPINPEPASAKPRKK